MKKIRRLDDGLYFMCVFKIWYKAYIVIIICKDIFLSL